MSEVSTDEVMQRCIAIVGEAKNVSPAGIGPETTFDELGADSLDKINISFAVEEAFSVEIPDNAIQSIKTVGDMARGVGELKEKQLRGAAVEG